jgi:hypothetical protein
MVLAKTVCRCVNQLYFNFMRKLHSDVTYMYIFVAVLSCSSMHIKPERAVWRCT